MGQGSKIKQLRGVKSFIGVSDHVCPFGSMAERDGELVYARINDRSVEASIKGALEELRTGKKAAILMFPSRITSLDECHRRSIEYMLAAGRSAFKGSKFLINASYRVNV